MYIRVPENLAIVRTHVNSFIYLIDRNETHNVMLLRAFSGIGSARWTARDGAWSPPLLVGHVAVWDSEVAAVSNSTKGIAPTDQKER